MTRTGKHTLAMLAALIVVAGNAPTVSAQDERGYLFPNTPLGIDFNGWISNGYTYNSDEPPSRYNGPMSFNDRDDEWQLNQLYFVMQREIDTSENMIDIGGRMDFIYGTDSRFTKAVGLELNQDGTPGLNAGQRFYQMAFPQFYTELGIGDLSIKAGHFYTIIGYETVTAPDNFFYSHAYTMQYGEPFTHTGVLTSLALTDNLTLMNGIHLGWDIFNVNNTAPAFANRGSYLGGVNMAMMDGLVNLAVTGTAGNELDASGVNYQSRTLISVVATTQLTDNIQSVIQSDIGRQLGGSGVTPGRNAEWYGVNSYLFMQLTDTVKGGLRCEWFRDDDGARVAGVGNGNPSGVGGFAGDFYEVSAGVNWSPLGNLIVRPEMRWDWYDPAAGIAARPFNDGMRGGMFTSAVDAILLW
ncbi:MAG: porin [Pirellulaceae bacterium]